MKVKVKREVFCDLAFTLGFQPHAMLNILKHIPDFIELEAEPVEGEWCGPKCNLSCQNNNHHKTDHHKLPEQMFYIEEPIALSVEVVGYLNDTADKINQIIRYL